MYFTTDRIACCEEAMSKPGPRQALRLVASGRVFVEVKKDGDLYLDEMDGKPVRYNGQKMGIAGAWPLIAAGMVDQYGVVTPKGQAFLAEIGDDQ